MARQYSKKVRKLLRKFWMEAYERELHSELTKLDQGFSEWREGRISSGELSHRIHRYETGPSRELYRTYNDGDRDLVVASAIVSGILDRDEVPDVLLEALRAPINFWASMKDDQAS
jgi:hypothetical protein